MLNLPRKRIKNLLLTSLTSFLLLTTLSARAWAATLEVSPAEGSLTTTTSIDIFANIEEAKSAVAVDAVLSYEPTQLSIDQITNGDWEVYTLKNIDEDTGTITVSAINSSDNALTGKVKVATLEVTPQASTGTTSLSFVISSATTDGSHVADAATGGDILTAGVDGSYTLGSSTSEAGTGSPGGGDTETESPEATPPATGSPSPIVSYALLAAGLILSGLASLRKAANATHEQY